MAKWQWGGKPVIFTEDGDPATTNFSNPRFLAHWQEEVDAEEVPRTCPWCGVLCESVEALAEHEKGCDE